MKVKRCFSALFVILLFAALKGVSSAAAYAQYLNGLPGTGIDVEDVSRAAVERDVSPMAPGFTAVDPVATQMISLAAGWNLVSSYVDPADPDLDTLLSGIDDDLVLVKNGAGQVYWPDFTLDEIGTWDVRQGYQIYMENPATLSISGALVSPPDKPIPLTAGWHMIAYLRDIAQPAAEAMDSVSDQLLIAKDGAGRVYWPGYSVNQIGALQPGNGYQVYLSAAGTLQYPDGPASADSGQILSGAISVPGDVDRFVLTAEAGDAIVVSLSKTAGTGYPVVGLYDSSGAKLKERSSSAHVDFSYQLPAAGEYMIEVTESAADETFVYNLFYHRLSDPAGAVEIAYSEIQTAAIVEAAEMDAFTFTAEAGDAIIAGLADTSGDHSLDLELYDSAGALLVDDREATYAEIIYNVTETADYTILVSHYYGVDAFDYSLFLQRINSPVGAVGTAFSENVSGSIVQPAEMDAYTLNAQADDALIIAFTKTAGEDWPMIRIFDAAGNKLKEGASTHTIFTYKFTETAEYTIVVSNRYGVGAFDYNLLIQRVNGPVGAVGMAYSDSLSGAIVEPSEMDAYTFSAQAGEAVIGGAVKIAGDNYIELRLYDAAGNRLAYSVDEHYVEITYNITETAEYTIFIHHSSGSGAFDYDLFLQRINSPVGALGIAYSENHTGSIVEPVEMDAYTFTAQAGDTIIAALAEGTAGFTVELRLYDSSGNKLSGPQSSSTAEIIYSVTETAEYTLFVGHSARTEPFDYNLFLQCINSPVGGVGIAYAENHAGSIVESAEIDAYTFTAQVGEVIIARMVKTAGPDYAELRLYDAAGNRLARGVNNDTDFTYPITETAEYTLLASHSSGVSAIDYNLFLQRINSPVGGVGIAYSENHTGSIVEPAEMDAFPFTAQAGDTIIAALAEGTAGVYVDLRLYDSSGNKLAGPQSSSTAELIYTVPETAEYILFAGHSSRIQSFDYNLFLQRINSPAGAVAITYGDNHAAAIVEPAEIDAYTFTAQAGEAIAAWMVKTAGPSFAELRLYNAAGTRLARNTGDDAEFTYYFTETAEYTLLANHSSGLSAIDYNLFLQRINNPVGGVGIAYSEIHSGSIAVPAEMDAYYFSAQAGEAIIVNLGKTAGDSHLEMQLFDVAGSRLAGREFSGAQADFVYSITEMADYTILINHLPGTGAFDYSLFFQRINSPVGAVPIAYSETQFGSIADAEMDAFTFTAQAGDAVVATLVKTSGDDHPEIRLYDSYGSELEDDLGNPAQITYSITETAEYTLLVFLSSGSGSFDYELRLELDT